MQETRRFRYTKSKTVKLPGGGTAKLELSSDEQIDDAAFALRDDVVIAMAESAVEFAERVKPREEDLKNG